MSCTCDATVPGAVESCGADTHECSFCGQTPVGARKAWCRDCLDAKRRCDGYARDRTPHDCPGCDDCNGVSKGGAQ